MDLRRPPNRALERFLDALAAELVERARREVSASDGGLTSASDREQGPTPTQNDAPETANPEGVKEKVL